MGYLNKDILVIGDVEVPEKAPRGGAVRAIRSIKEYAKLFNVHLLTPPGHVSEDTLKHLQARYGLKSVMRTRSKLRFLSDERLGFIYLLTPTIILDHLIKIEKEIQLGPQAVIVLNEIYPYLRMGQLIMEKLKVPGMAIIHNPLLYEKPERRKAIERAHYMWIKELYNDDLVGKITRLIRAQAEITIGWSDLIKNVLEEYDILVAISRATVVEMGKRWHRKFYILDPGVSLDDEDLNLIDTINSRIKTREKYIMFGGRVDALKGFIEAVYAFKKIVKENPHLKLIATGYVEERLRSRIERFLKRMELESKVVLTGVIPRSQRFELVRRSLLMLYPSHVDAFSYAVAESLCLETPVVAYDIPAIRIYYGDNPGVRIVREGDIDALAEAVFNILEHRDTVVRKPILRKWSDIMNEETMLVKKIVGIQGS